MPVYQGPNSCMAKREGVYVKRIERPGVDTIPEAVALAYMVLRDYRRGYTYDPDHNCRKIKMTWELAKKRLRFIVTLSKYHGATKKEQKVIRKLISYAIKHKRLPSRINGKPTKPMIEKMIVKKRG